MTVTGLRVEDNGSLTIQTTLPADGRDEEIARAFFHEVGHRSRIEDAVVDYDRRVKADNPYEDAVSLDELARDFGR